MSIRRLLVSSHRISSRFLIAALRAPSQRRSPSTLQSCNPHTVLAHGRQRLRRIISRARRASAAAARRVGARVRRDREAHVGRRRGAVRHRGCGDIIFVVGRGTSRRRRRRRRGQRLPRAQVRRVQRLRRLLAWPRRGAAQPAPAALAAQRLGARRRRGGAHGRAHVAPRRRVDAPVGGCAAAVVSMPDDARARAQARPTAVSRRCEPDDAAAVVVVVITVVRGRRVAVFARTRSSSSNSNNGAACVGLDGVAAQRRPRQGDGDDARGAAAAAASRLWHGAGPDAVAGVEPSGR